MTYAANSFVSLEEVYGEVKLNPLMPDTNDYDALIRKWIIRAVKEIKAYNQIEPQSVCCTIVGGKFKLPCNFVVFNPGTIPIRIHGNTRWGCDPVYSESTIFTRGTDFSPSYLTFQIQDGCVVFNDEDLSGTCTLNFMGVLVNERNEPVIKEMFSRAVVSFVLYQAGVNNIYNNKDAWMDHKFTWADGCQSYLGDANTPDTPQLQKIDYLMNTLFPVTPYTGYGI